MMKFNLHTIILLCGPSCCGKTYYVKEHLIPGLRRLENGFRLNIQSIASDDLRRELLGDPMLDLRDPNNSFRLKFTSEPAFRMLEQQLDLVTSFPINAEFVIVDTTALNEDFRMSMIKLARKNNYNIDLLLFDFSIGMYYQYAGSSNYVTKHIHRMRSEVLPNLGSRFYNQVLRIRDRNNPPLIESIVDFDLYRRCHFLDDAVVVGDLHGCYNALLQIERAAGSAPLIVLGDVIDKGPDSLAILRHLKEHPEKYPLHILGNHESYVYRFLNSLSEKSSAHNYHTSVPQYEGNTEYKELVDWYFETAVPFVKIRDSIYVTHAPCHDQYIGKLDTHSQRQQRFTLLDDNISDRLQKESNSNYPKHIFGHVAFQKPFEFRNKIGIDTGGVYGNTFSYFWKNRVYSIPAAEKYADNKLIEVGETGIDPSELDFYEQKRIEIAIREKINFVSGTISPTASDRERMKIEPIETAIKKFQACGVEEISVQKKYMGSRCEAYISRDIEQCSLTSRNGFKIKRLHNDNGEELRDLTPVYQSILAQPKIAAIFQHFPDTETILLDGELMPWYALGKGLIETQYQLIDQAAASEFELLKSTGFEAVLDAEYKSQNYAAFIHDPKISDKIINSNKKSTYKLLKNYRHIPVAEMEQYLQIYREQIAIYGTAKPIEYCPFDILKLIHRDGSETLFRETPVSERYEMVSKDAGILVHLQNENEITELIEYFAKLPDDTEGLVLKCNKPGRSKIYMLKVRNEKYLTIIYGFDYLEPIKNAALIHKKNVSQKTSIANHEYEFGWELASIPRNRINGENEEYQRILAALIFEERNETTLDPRL
ncbi:MAG: metallophosphoesterase [Planctomycetaceae bacterium]|jgi:predicted kinase|nr:metallophosphoesterase [Planctomycetaceae bacterium]